MAAGAELGLVGPVLSRSRLHERLTSGLDAKMTLIVAPAGYGKTMLMSDWAATLKIPVVWVALTEHDNDPGHLVRSVVQAVEQAIGGDSGMDERLGFVSPDSAPQLIEEWIARLNADNDFVLLIDDFHILRDPAAVETAQRLVEAAPPHVHLCVAARHDPPLAVARLRLDGRLTEVRQAELAFTIEEMTAFLTATSVDLSEELLVLLHTRTEGWAAALRLALISMTQSGDAARVVRGLAGTDRIIAEYLIEEVLSQMDPVRQQFLLRTSILDEVTVELARLLTGRADSAVILDELVAAGDFTTEPKAGRYLYHRLLRDMLRARFRDVDPELFVELQRRAGLWSWEHSEWARAIGHSMNSAQLDQATAWLGEASRTLASSGQSATVAELSGRLLDMTVEPSRLLLLTRMWALYNISARPTEVDRLLERLISELATDESEVSPNRIVHGGDPRAFVDASALPWLRGIQARAFGDLDTLLALDEPKNLPSPSGRVEGFVGEGYLWTEQYGRAEPLFETFLEHGRNDSYAPSIVHATGSLAFVLVGRGRLDEAEPLLAYTSELIDRFGIGHMINCQYAQLVNGWLQWERGNLQMSESILASTQSFAGESGDVPISVQHALQRSRTHWSLGDHSGARDILDRAEHATSGRLGTGYFADRIAFGRMTLDLLDGEPDAAEQWIPDWRDRLASPKRSDGERERLALSRLAAALGVMAIVHDGPSKDSAATNHVRRIEVAKLAAACALAERDRDQAVRSLTAAMRESVHIGASQRVVDERHLFSSIFDAAAEAAGFADVTAKSPGAAQQGDDRAPPAWFVEPISQRELEVLGHLPTHLSYPEIGDVLYVSTNTVKTHVKAIFRKLAVSRRADAVNRAREFGLLPD